MSNRRTQSKLSLFKQFCQSYSINNLASLWYSLLTTLLQIYIIVQAIYRFSAYISIPWPNGNAPQESINIYMLFIASGILIIPFFIIVSLMKVGNYSNDGRKLGSFNINKCLRYLNEDDDNINKNGWLKIIWKHTLPIGPVLHLLMAICFLFPRLITESQLIRHGFINKSHIWKTDLDFILKRFNGKIFNFFGYIQTINVTEHQQIFSESVSLGQYYIRSSKSLSDSFYQLDESGKFSAEFLNFIVALSVLTARYPSVFWRVHKQFSFILTLQLLLNSIQSIIAFNAFQVAFKIFVCDPTLMLIRFRESSSLSLVQLSWLLLIYIILLQFSTVSVYIYGLHKYREYRYARTKYFQMKYENLIVVNLLPYLFAMMFFLMLALTVGPLFYEFAIIYCGSLSIYALLILLSTIFYFLFWIILWIVLSLKTVWNFQFEDVETNDSSFSKKNGFSAKHASILITNQGKLFKIKDDLATMTIINFIQSNGFEKSKFDNDKLDCNPSYHRTLNKNFRYNSYKAQNLNENTSKINNIENNSDSDGEYTTFYKVKRSYSLNQKNNHQKYCSLLKSKKSSFVDNGHDTELSYQNHRNSLKKPTTLSNNIAYGLRYTADANNHDEISDISSGFHSNGSHSSLTSSNEKSLIKSDSLESLMKRIQHAANDRPNIRSLESLQKCATLLNQTEPKCSIMSTFPKMEKDQEMVLMDENSKLIEFTENPDYSKYYLPEVIVSN